MMRCCELYSSAQRSSKLKLFTLMIDCAVLRDLGDKIKLIAFRLAYISSVVDITDIGERCGNIVHVHSARIENRGLSRVLKQLRVDVVGCRS